MNIYTLMCLIALLLWGEHMFDTYINFQKQELLTVKTQDIQYYNQDSTHIQLYHLLDNDTLFFDIKKH